ncbi:MAG: hypothetical protein HYT94_01720 [Parcubacteria group bacterium]|nr:hypothetical protein [Parcubacteria group bacterium]
MSGWISEDGTKPIVVGPVKAAKEPPRDFIHENGSDLNLNEDPTEDDLGFDIDTEE